MAYYYILYHKLQNPGFMREAYAGFMRRFMREAYAEAYAVARRCADKLVETNLVASLVVHSSWMASRASILCQHDFGKTSPLR